MKIITRINSMPISISVSPNMSVSESDNKQTSHSYIFGDKGWSENNRSFSESRSWSVNQSWSI